MNPSHHVEKLREELPQVFDPRGPQGDFPWPVYDPDREERIEIDIDDFHKPGVTDELFSEEAITILDDTETSSDMEAFGDRVPRELVAPNLRPREDRRDDENPQRRGGSGGSNSSYGPPPPFDHEAWYQPFHFFPHDWGIFIRQSALLRLAAQLRAVATLMKGAGLSDREKRECLRASLLVYFDHEFFHHRVECFATRVEVHMRRPAYVPQFHRSHWLLEEALANAEAYRRARPAGPGKLMHLIAGATVTYLRTVFPHMPPGYRDAVHYLTPTTLKSGEGQLEEHIHLAAGGSGAGCTPQIWKIAPYALTGFGRRSSRIYCVLDVSGRRARGALFWAFTSADLATVAMRAGCQKRKGGKGSHEVYEKPNGGIVVIPGQRKDVAKGTAHRVLKQLGLSPGQATAMLRS